MYRLLVICAQCKRESYRLVDKETLLASIAGGLDLDEPVIEACPSCSMRIILERTFYVCREFIWN
uniref:Uncharacterized protein n=1 Tax=viral metagenome TaxID=1070528 RepID=A0A6M3JIE2_9ZZZZ